MQEMQEKQVQSLGREDPLEEEMAPQSNILAWRISTDRGAWRAAVHGAASMPGCEVRALCSSLTKILPGKAYELISQRLKLGSEWRGHPAGG